MFRLLFRSVCRIYQQAPIRRTQVFHQLSNKQLATPQLTRALVRKRIPYHSRMSQVGLYHKKRVRHAIRSCFSQKKHKVFKRVHKVTKTYYSKILNKNLRFVMSMKAYRCIMKMGSFDNYILLTKPKDLDSKMGQYLRTIMLKKINDPSYRIPYILSTGRKQRIKKYQRYLMNKKSAQFVIPKQFKKNLQTFQKKFGKSLDQLNNQDYQKYLDLQKLKKSTGNQIQPDHPLLLQLNQKLKTTLSQQQQQKLESMSKQFKNQYLNHPKNTAARRIKYEKMQKQAEIAEHKIKQAFIKFQSTGGDNN